MKSSSCVNKLSAMLARACFLPILSLSHIYANGFKIQEQSLNATALSSAYIAGARGADASYYNPANMGFSNDWGENKSEFRASHESHQYPGL